MASGVESSQRMPLTTPYCTNLLCQIISARAYTTASNSPACTPFHNSRRDISIISRVFAQVGAMISHDDSSGDDDESEDEVDMEQISGYTIECKTLSQRSDK
jgi:hypothetical protein